MDPKRTSAVKHWFEQLLQVKLKVEPVDGWAKLWKRHVGTIVCLMRSGNLKVCEETTSTEAYEKAFHALESQSVEPVLLEQLKPDSAATGDNFEVAKFLVVLLNEMRINQPALFEEDYGLSDEENKHIGAVLRYLEDQQNWDPYESWPALLFQNSVSPSLLPKDFITPKYLQMRRPDRYYIPMSEKVDIRLSPLSDLVSSPRSRELRIAREKDKKLKSLHERCKLLEFEKDDLESSLRIAAQENERLAKRVCEITDISNEKEARCQALIKELDDWRNKARGAESETKQLKQQLKALKQELCTRQRQLREAEFDVSAKQSAVDSWQRAAAWEEQQRLKLERQREDLLLELGAAKEAKLAVEEQLRQRTSGAGTEIAELRSINEALRSQIKAVRLERDEALASHNEQLIEVQRESREIINGKESQIAKYIAGFAKMKKQLSVTQSSVEEVRNSASQVRCFCRELENMRVEIQGLWLLFASILDGCQVLQDEIAEKKALVKSLQNSAALSDFRAKTLAASFEEQLGKHVEAMTTKEAILNDKEQKLYEAWSQLLASAEMNNRLREELKKRDAAYQLLEERFSAAEERYATMSRHFSINSIMDIKSTDETVKTISHFPVAADISFDVLPQEFHPLPEVEDENDLLSSSSVNGSPYLLNVNSQYCVPTITSESQSEHNTSVDSERLAELKRRNKTVPPHLRSTYPAELQHLTSGNLDEETFQNAEHFVLPKNENDVSSLVSPCSLSKRRCATRPLRNVKRQFRKMMRDSSASKSSVNAPDERSPRRPVD